MPESSTAKEMLPSATLINKVTLPSVVNLAEFSNSKAMTRDALAGVV
jgi:hypothetical protein